MPSFAADPFSYLRKRAVSGAVANGNPMPPPDPGGTLLIETGDALLLESGDKLLLE